LANIPDSLLDESALVTKSKRSAPRVAFGQIVEAQYVNVGQKIYSKDRRIEATIKADSHLLWGAISGSIHKVAALAQGKIAFNGWDYWYCEDAEGKLISIDELRDRYRAEHDLK
jgi:site-specific DNA-methyltransferase (adenine-specific)/modification methylase